MKKELIAVTKKCMNEEFHDLLDTGGTVNQKKRHLSSKTLEISVLERYLESDGDQTKVSVKNRGLVYGFRSCACLYRALSPSLAPYFVACPSLRDVLATVCSVKSDLFDCFKIYFFKVIC